MRLAITRGLALRQEVGGQLIHSGLIVADLGNPQLLNLLGVLERPRHPPAVHEIFPVGKRHGGELYAQSIHLGNEAFNVEVRHFRFQL